MRLGDDGRRLPDLFVPWKPDECEAPGCTARYPSFSRDGLQGPWRCREHDATASRRPPEDPFEAEKRRAKAAPPNDPPPDRLL